MTAHQQLENYLLEHSKPFEYLGELKEYLTGQPYHFYSYGKFFIKVYSGCFVIRLQEQMFSISGFGFDQLAEMIDYMDKVCQAFYPNFNLKHSQDEQGTIQND